MLTTFPSALKGVPEVSKVQGLPVMYVAEDGVGKFAIPHFFRSGYPHAGQAINNPATTAMANMFREGTRTILPNASDIGNHNNISFEEDTQANEETCSTKTAKHDQQNGRNTNPKTKNKNKNKENHRTCTRFVRTGTRVRTRVYSSTSTTHCADTLERIMTWHVDDCRYSSTRCPRVVHVLYGRMWSQYR